jgi:hypothetical protein
VSRSGSHQTHMLANHKAFHVVAGHLLAVYEIVTDSYLWKTRGHAVRVDAGCSRDDAARVIRGVRKQVQESA